MYLANAKRIMKLEGSKVQMFVTLCKSVNVQMSPQMYQIYNIDDYRFSNLTRTELIRMFQKICRIRVQKHNKKMWIFNQLKIFVWITLKYVEYWGKSDDQFTMDQWEYLSEFFYQKKPMECKYFIKQAHKVIISQYFTQEQDQLLQSLVRKQQPNKIKWSSISLQMYLESQQRFFKKSTRYRERYINYLDQTVYRKQWNHLQQRHLLNLVLQIGKKWSKISKILNNRTQYSVNNQYTKLLYKSRKCFRLPNEQMTIPQEIKLIQRYHKLQSIQQWCDPNLFATQLQKQEDLKIQDQKQLISDQNPVRTRNLPLIPQYEPYVLVSSYGCVSPFIHFRANNGYSHSLLGL